MDIPGFVIFGAPRTKKTHSRIIQIPKAGARKCNTCGYRPGFPKILPSEAHEKWFEDASAQAIGIKRGLAGAGVELPITGPLNVMAHFYRETAVGDATGYYQALADLLQAVGIIGNDSQIDSWDGSRRRKDAAQPRIEVWLELIEEPGQQLTLDTAG